MSGEPTCTCALAGDPFKAPELHAANCPVRRRLEAEPPRRALNLPQLNLPQLCGHGAHLDACPACSAAVLAAVNAGVSPGVIELAFSRDPWPEAQAAHAMKWQNNMLRVLDGHRARARRRRERRARAAAIQATPRGGARIPLPNDVELEVSWQGIAGVVVDVRSEREHTAAIFGEWSVLRVTLDEARRHARGWRYAVEVGEEIEATLSSARGDGGTNHGAGEAETQSGQPVEPSAAVETGAPACEPVRSPAVSSSGREWKPGEPYDGVKHEGYIDGSVAALLGLPLNVAPGAGRPLHRLRADVGSNSADAEFPAGVFVVVGFDRDEVAARAVLDPDACPECGAPKGTECRKP